MNSRRDYIPLKTRLAAALCQMLRPNEDGVLERVISHDEAKALTPEEILSKFHFDHYPIRHEMGGPSEPWNLVPLPVSDHRNKTAKIDIPQIAKGKRIDKDQQAFRAKMLAKSGQAQMDEAGSEEDEAGASPRQRRAIGSGSKLSSGPMPFGRKSKLKKTMGGKVIER